MTAPLVIAAHGTADPAGRRTVRDLTGLVRDRLPGVPVVVGWLDHAEPLLAQALTATGPPGAPDRPVIVPLLLATGFHAAVDIPRAAAAAGASVTAPVGGHPGVVRALQGRLADVAAPDQVRVVLAAAGSSDPAAVADVEAVAAALSAARGVRVDVGYATTRHPDVSTAVRDALPDVALATHLIAPGRFADSIATAGRAAGAGWVSPPIGAHPGLADAVADRYRSALTPGRCRR